jgi:hypothetical protein
MGMRVRIGPFSVSSRGRVGVRAGPVSFYGGGTRHRRRSSSSGGGAFIGVLTVIVVLALAVEYWYVSLPLLSLIGAASYFAVKAGGRRSAERAAAAAREQAEAERRWLVGPPPILPLPGRFTQNWFASYVPGLHPGQVPTLMAELRARGWTQERIDQRVRPFLDANPYHPTDT